MLNDPVLAIALAIAQTVAFVYVMSILQIKRSKTCVVAFACRVGKYSLAIWVQRRIFQTLTTEILAADVSAIVFSALATGHKILRCSFDAGTENTLVDERK